MAKLNSHGFFPWLKSYFFCSDKPLRSLIFQHDLYLTLLLATKGFDLVWVLLPKLLASVKVVDT